MTFKLTSLDRRIVLKIVLIYSIFGGLWIYLSDMLLGLMVRDPALMTRIATYKGLLFIIATALLLYYLVGRYVSWLGESQRQLDDSVHQLRLASFTFANISDAVYWVASDSRIVFANNSACRMSGYSLEELLSMKVADINPNFALNDWAPHWEELQQAGSLKLETTNISKDKTIYEVEIVANYFKYLDKEYNCAIARDISDRIRVEKTLRASEESLRSLLELMPVGVACTTPDGVMEYINPDFISRFGYTLEDVPTVADWFLKAYPDSEYRETLQAIWAEQFTHARNEGGQIPPREVKVTCKDGTVRDVLITTQMSQNGMVAIFTDITEQENRRQELIRNQKLESIGVLAGGIAHDFNNILTGILGNVSYARMFVDREHKAAKPLQEAERASQRAAELAQQLLTFAKGGQPVTRAVALRQVIEESVSLVLRGSNVTARFDGQDGLWPVEADEGQISQVFNNLVLNAVQSMPGGGVLAIRTENIDIDDNNVLSIQAGRYVRVQVTDQGCGIPVENLKNIFDPYFTTKAGGSGLGLASVHSIVNKHGGYISVRSSEERGTTFEILLPASFEKPKQVSSHHEAVVQPDREFAVLVMDDEEMIRDLAYEILTNFGYRVTTCSHGQEAIDLYRAAFWAGVPFRVVIMDLTVPGGMGGKEAASAIRAIDPDACLIVSSGYSSDQVIANYRAYGFSGAVIKPYTVKDLASTLAALTTETTARRQP